MRRFSRVMLVGLPLFVLAWPQGAGAAPRQVHLGWEGDPRNTVTVTWRSAEASGEVQFGPSAAYGQTVKAQSSPFAGDHLHHARLTGLKQGTAYHYRCGRAGAWSPDRTLRTAPAAGSAGFRFVALGDSRSDDTARAKVRAAVQQRSPAFVVHTGDFVSDGRSQSQWDRWFATMEPLIATAPLMGALGNHEQNATIYYQQFAFGSHSPAAAGYEDETYYSFDYGNVHFIALSTSHAPGPQDAQALWLKQDLIQAARRSTVRWTVAFAHAPPYTTGPHGNSTSVQRAWNHLFESFGVDVTFWGHDHTYERTKPLFQDQVTGPGGVVYIVTGGAGAPLYSAKGGPFTALSKTIYHYLEVELTGSKMILTARDPDHKAFDTLTLDKPGPKSRWVMDGALDAGAKKLAGSASGPLRGLHAGFDGRYLYLAADGMPTGRDHLLLLSPEKPKAAGVAAPWSKAGTVWRYTDRLALESDTGWSNWQRAAAGTLIPAGSVWRYRDDGKDLGGGWTAPGYDDSSWKSGPAQLGYGDGDEATVLHNASPNYPSAYFRRSFTLQSVPAEATLRLTYDDGAAVWINGQQVMAQNMGNGTAYSAWASPASGDNAQATATVKQGSGGPFRAGKNVVAVMVKQANSSSSDLSFDLSLELASPPQPVTARASNPAGAVMEGQIDLAARFGKLPPSVFLALAAYDTGSGGALQAALPAGDGDGALEPGEWVEFRLGGSGSDASLPGDRGTPTGDGPRPGADSAAPTPDRGSTPPTASGDSGCGCGVGRSPAEGSGAALLTLILLIGALVHQRRGQRAK